MPGMTLTFVLRLAEGELQPGQVVGRIEAVSSGAQATFRSVDDLAAFLLHESAGHAHPATTDTEDHS